MAEDLSKTIYDHFVNSDDYNGISLNNLPATSTSSLLETITSLIKEDKISLQFPELTVNSYIVRFGHYSVDDQLKYIDQFGLNSACAYPTPTQLKLNRDVNGFDGRPFSKRLALGEAQIKPVYFETDVLERYFNDPRYTFSLEDYSGQISIHSEYYETGSFQSHDEVFIQSFGMAYKETGKRAIAVYLRYLDNLSPEHQTFWLSKEITTPCKILKEYYDNTALGLWVFSHSVYSAFVEEQHTLNGLSKIIVGESLFLKTFEEEKRPKEFTFFLRPTLANYETFVSLLDKMLSDNINKNFFKDKIDLFHVKQIPGQDLLERIHKGTLTLLEEWLRKFYHHPDDTIYDELLKPFKDIRKARQSPAHKISTNAHDEKYFDLQSELITEAYYALKKLRIIFGSHRKAKSYNIPDWLDNGIIKSF